MITDLKFWLADFVPYSAESWIGLLQTTHALYWPYSAILGVNFVFLIVALQTRVVWMLRATVLLVAMGWFWCGLVFLRLHYSNLTWVADYLVVLFVVQGILILFHINATPLTSTKIPASNFLNNPTILNMALFLLPLIQWMFGNSFDSLSWIALNPDATAFASIVILYQLGIRKLYMLVIPFLWFIYSLSTSWPLGLIPESTIALTAFVFSVVACISTSNSKSNENSSAY